MFDWFGQFRIDVKNTRPSHRLPSISMQKKKEEYITGWHGVESAVFHILFGGGGRGLISPLGDTSLSCLVSN